MMLQDMLQVCIGGDGTSEKLRTSRWESGGVTSLTHVQQSCGLFNDMVELESECWLVTFPSMPRLAAFQYPFGTRLV